MKAEPIPQELQDSILLCLSLGGGFEPVPKHRVLRAFRQIEPVSTIGDEQLWQAVQVVAMKSGFSVLDTWNLSELSSR
jgi:hypothetical protein